MLTPQHLLVSPHGSQELPQQQVRELILTEYEAVETKLGGTMSANWQYVRHSNTHLCLCIVLTYKLDLFLPYIPPVAFFL